MRRAPAIGAGTIISMALFAATASSALAALPEFSAPFPNPFKSTSKTLLIESTPAKVKVKCTADTNTGAVTGPATAEVTFRFTNCTSTAVAGVLCNSPNGAPGEIVTEKLIGQLGYVTRAPKVVGLDLQNPTGGPLAVILCGGLVIELRGSVIGRVAPLNKKVTPPATVKLAFSQKAGQQAIRMLEGGPVDVPLMSTGGGPLEEAGLASADALTFAAPITIKA
jgi:hypothetical protein